LPFDHKISRNLADLFIVTAVSSVYMTLLELSFILAEVPQLRRIVTNCAREDTVPRAPTGVT
jgi:hypothetical protein